MFGCLGDLLSAASLSISFFFFFQATSQIQSPTVTEDVFWMSSMDNLIKAHQTLLFIVKRLCHVCHDVIIIITIFIVE